MTDTVAVLMPGDMGHATGRVLAGHGVEPITCLAGRSERTKALAQAAGFRDVETLDAVVEQASLILSILPPASALSLAGDVSQAMARTGAKPVYVDCNAISPETAKAVGATITEAGAPFIDAGIIGLKPDGVGPGPRFYVSGPDTGPMLALDGKGFVVRAVGAEPGRASALKMCYAGLTKGTWTLHTAVLLAAERQGLSAELREEFEYSQSAALSAMEARIPRLPADSGRWVGEMEEIAKTFADAGVPSGFHEGAAAVFRILAETPFASETRENFDAERTMEETLRVAAGMMEKP
ncbi:MAG: NAD(P)-dependent oxidoreductase [Alphaproteobacteria bacterium]|nr:NAD(P)-dependent oxidoreductase [Alphaproteobacteria bacterium]MBT7943917.1 NAD(P)-dependent oxidoreductase [Alphaproteobacteria bacterium]